MRFGFRNRLMRGRRNNRIEQLRELLGARSIVLVGLMGAGKTAIGRLLAKRLRLPFVDADHEIETAAGMSISEIFAKHGEAHFRDGERRVIERLLQAGPQVLATGGGAFMNAETRAAIGERGISLWLKADLDVLMERVSRKNNRPLLQTDDPRAVMQRLLETRYPVYGLADCFVVSRDVAQTVIVDEAIGSLYAYLAGEAADHAGSAPEGTQPGAQASGPNDNNDSAQEIDRHD
jgi:shikimate kinase